MSRELPRHIAIIMDGNGRWARHRGILRTAGHEKGADAMREITRESVRLGIEELTFFALSTENFRRRPGAEIRFLMRLLRDYLISERDLIEEQDIRLRAIGHTEDFPGFVQEELRRSEETSAGNQGMILRLALNYGSRREILDAARAIIEEVEAGRMRRDEIERLNEEGFRRFLYDADMTDPDLLIRTGGEYRVSNFLLWQLSYAEIWITDVLWPEFTSAHLAQAIEDFGMRERRFGSVSPDGLEEKTR